MKILAYPKDNNPYQSLLYSHFDKNYKIKYLCNPTKSHLIGLMMLPLQVTIFRIKGYSIFHLHWLYTFQLTLNNFIFHTIPFRIFFTLYFLFFIFFLKLLRYKIVWTVHNLKPHEKQFIYESGVIWMISKISNLIIVHSKATLSLMDKVNYCTKNVSIVPIGNYINYYPNVISEINSRKTLKLNTSDFVFGFFGKIEKYKGVDKLIQSFNQLNLSGAKLLIVGPCYNLMLKKELVAIANNNTNIKTYFNFIPPQDVQIYLNSVDIFVMPFEDITTTSSIILAMSFKKSFIAPLIGEITDYPHNIGFYYSPNTNFNLQLAMKNAYLNRHKLKEFGQYAYEYVKTHDWIKIGFMTMSLFNKIFKK